MKRRQFLIAAGVGLATLSGITIGLLRGEAGKNPGPSAPVSAHEIELPSQAAGADPTALPTPGPAGSALPAASPTPGAAVTAPPAELPAPRAADPIPLRQALLDDFFDPCAAGAVDGTPATDGISLRVLAADSAGQVSISDGALRLAGAAPAEGGPRLYSSTQIYRAEGQALGFRFRVDAGKELPSLGWITASGQPLAALRRTTAEGGGGVIECGDEALPALNLYSGCWYDAAIFLQSSGAAFALNDGAGLELALVSGSGGATPGFLGFSAQPGVEQGASVDCWYAPETSYFPPTLASEPAPAGDYMVDLGTNSAWIEARVMCGDGKAGLRLRAVDEQNEYRVYLEESRLKVEQVMDGNVTPLADEAVVYSAGAVLAARFNELTLTVYYRGALVGMCCRKIGAPALVGASLAGVYASGEGSHFEQFLALPVSLDAPEGLRGRLIESRRVLCLGDSLTSADHAFGYQNRLRKRLGDGWVTVDGGVSGQTTAQMLARLPHHLLRWRPEVVVVLGGTNDAALAEPAGFTQSNLQAIYQTARAAGARVAAVSIPPCGGAKNWAPEKLDTIDQVNAWILGGAQGVDFTIDAFAEFENPGTRALKREYNGGDHIHLSPLAYNTLGNMIHGSVRW